MNDLCEAGYFFVFDSLQVDDKIVELCAGHDDLGASGQAAVDQSSPQDPM